jgi:hypothetical protein
MGLDLKQSRITSTQLIAVCVPVNGDEVRSGGVVAGVVADEIPFGVLAPLVDGRIAEIAGRQLVRDIGADHYPAVAGSELVLAPVIAM